MLAASPGTSTVGRVNKSFLSRKGMSGFLVLGMLALAACGGGASDITSDTGSVAPSGSLTDGDLVKEALRNALGGPVRADVVGFDRVLITVDADGNWSAGAENEPEGKSGMLFVDGALYNRVALYGTGVDGSFAWARLDTASSYLDPELVQVQILAQMTSGTGFLEGDILESTPEEWLSARDTMLDSAEIVSTSAQTGARTWSVVLKPMYVHGENVYEEDGAGSSFSFEGDDPDTYDPNVSLTVTLDDSGSLVSLRNDADASEVTYERGGEVAAIEAPKEYLEGEEASLAVARDTAVPALHLIVDAWIRGGNGSAQSDAANPGRGVRITDIDIGGSNYAVLSDGVITAYGGLGLCIQVYVSGSGNAAEFVKSPVKTASAIVMDQSGRVTSGTCA